MDRQITIEDIKRDYGAQVRGNVIKARTIETLEAENAKLTRQVSAFRRDRLDEYENDDEGTMWQCGFAWGLWVGAAFASLVITTVILLRL